LGAGKKNWILRQRAAEMFQPRGETKKIIFRSARPRSRVRMFAAAAGVQFSSEAAIGFGCGCSHLQRGVEAVAQVDGGGTAPQPSRRKEFHLSGTVRLWNEDVGGDTIERTFDGESQGLILRSNG
jgi:hypothetical protein